MAVRAVILFLAVSLLGSGILACGASSTGSGSPPAVDGSTLGRDASGSDGSVDASTNDAGNVDASTNDAENVDAEIGDAASDVEFEETGPTIDGGRVGLGPNQMIIWGFPILSESPSQVGAWLDYWHSLGVTGLALGNEYWASLGGSEDWIPTADAGALTGSSHGVQLSVVTTGVVQQLHARGMTAWLILKPENYYNCQTPWAEWFDDPNPVQKPDPTWALDAGGNAVPVMPLLANLAGAARVLGFDGLGFDEEDYGANGCNANQGVWGWTYPGNTHTEAEVRAQVRARGVQVMQTIVSAFPNVPIFTYHDIFPGTWDWNCSGATDGVGCTDGGGADPAVYSDYWHGLLSVPGWSAIYFLDAYFYKGANEGSLGFTDDAAWTYQMNGWFSEASNAWADVWPQVWDKVNVCGFSWFDGDPNLKDQFNSALNPTTTNAYGAESAQTLLESFSRWSMGGMMQDFSYEAIRTEGSTSLGGNGFYTPFGPLILAAEDAGVVDAIPPTLTIAPGGGTTLTGTATDNFAIRAVAYRQTGGPSGAATMTWSYQGNPKSITSWQMNWKITGLNPTGTVTVTAYDIHGLSSSATMP